MMPSRPTITVRLLPLQLAWLDAVAAVRKTNRSVVPVGFGDPMEPVSSSLDVTVADMGTPVVSDQDSCLSGVVVAKDDQA
jgi:hypothetical protein